MKTDRMGKSDEGPYYPVTTHSGHQEWVSQEELEATALWLKDYKDSLKKS